MAEDSAQEKTEHPTRRRIDEARQRGEVPRSRDFGGAVIVLVVACLLLFEGRDIHAELAEWMCGLLSFDRARLEDGRPLPAQFGWAVVDGLWAVRWLLVLPLCVALIAPAVNGGFVLSSKAVSPNWGRLSPLKGLGRLLGSQGWMELGRTLVKFAVIGVVLVAVLWAQLDALLALGSVALEPMVAGGASIALRVFVVLSAVVAALALLDIPLQRWNYIRRLRMTKQEIKEEMKNAEGNPEIRSRIRRRQRELGRRRMLDDVKRADVVITNPTEFAVALVYDEAAVGVPVLVAKGRADFAAAIKQRAAASGVPIVEAPPLARALYYTAEVNSPVPAPLYRAVAQVLAYVFQLSALGPDLRQPDRPEPVVPVDFLFDEDGRTLAAGSMP